MRAMKRLFVITLASLTVACAASAQTRADGEPSKDELHGPETQQTDGSPPSPTPEADRLLAEFLAEPPMAITAGTTWDDVRNAMMRGAKRVNEAYKSKLQGADRDTTAYIQLQRSRVFLAVACQILRVEPAPDATEAEAAAHRARAVEAAHLFFPGADEALRNAVEADGSKSPEAAQLLLVVRSAGGPDEICSEAGDYLE
jgi:hypothetical protein